MIEQVLNLFRKKRNNRLEELTVEIDLRMKAIDSMNSQLIDHSENMSLKNLKNNFIEKMKLLEEKESSFQKIEALKNEYNIIYNIILEIEALYQLKINMNEF